MHGLVVRTTQQVVDAHLRIRPLRVEAAVGDVVADDLRPESPGAESYDGNADQLDA